MTRAGIPTAIRMSVKAERRFYSEFVSKQRDRKWNKRTSSRETETVLIEVIL